MPKKILTHLIIIGALLLSAMVMHAQDSVFIKSPNRFKIVALPVFFYTPDTRFGFGAGGLSTFNFHADSLYARRSSATLGIVYTQLRQILLYVPFQLFPHNADYWISGEAGYYRYVFNFFGTGNAIPADYIEKYDATFPRIRLNISKKISTGIYAGLRYALDDFQFTRTDPNGILAQKTLSGSEGGRISGLGLGINVDTRNIQFFPSKGWFGELSIYDEGRWSGSEFNYTRFTLDLTHYIQAGPKGIVALNAVQVFSFGDVPFHQMPVIGGTKRLRGYFEGKYRDKHLMIFQGEYRRPLFWRIGSAAFGGVGLVADSFNTLQTNHIRYNFGAGLRFQIDKAQKINIRADYGFGYRSKGFYLTFGEAF
jgi:outer membrane protein assembly factor BamA